MENQEEIREETVSTPTDPLSIGLGEDKPQVAAKRVTVKEIRLDDVNLNGKNKQKVVLVCAHPDVESVEVTSVKYERGDKVAFSGIWYNLDADNKIVYRSALGAVLKHARVSSVAALKGVVFDTVVDERGYLAVKAY